MHELNLCSVQQVIAALHEAAVADPGRARRSSSFSRTVSARNSAFGRLSASAAAVPASVLVGWHLCNMNACKTCSINIFHQTHI